MSEIKNKNILLNIKSSYIIKDIFTFLQENKKLDIIIYNKQLQNTNEIDIKDYKKASGRYKIGEKNGKGSEYTLDKNKLIFEGEYLNGKRNGKGKEFYYSGKIKFEGEYLNGKRNGKGKEFHDWFTQIKFEGEYLNGERNGIGKEYDYKEELRFEGEYKNGKRWNGKGYIKGKIDFEIKNGNGLMREYEIGQLIFEGEYLNGERNGKGKEYGTNGLLYFEGEYLNGKRHGKGEEYDFDWDYDMFNSYLSFRGEYLNGERNGKGIEYDPYGIIYEGEYLNGKRLEGKEK